MLVLSIRTLKARILEDETKKEASATLQPPPPVPLSRQSRIIPHVQKTSTFLFFE